MQSAYCSTNRTCTWWCQPKFFRGPFSVSHSQTGPPGSLDYTSSRSFDIYMFICLFVLLYILIKVLCTEHFAQQLVCGLISTQAVTVVSLDFLRDTFYRLTLIDIFFGNSSFDTFGHKLLLCHNPPCCCFRRAFVLFFPNHPRHKPLKNVFFLSISNPDPKNRFDCMRMVE